jgi:hypothetical protein
MVDIKNQLEQVIEALDQRVQKAKHNANDFNKRELNGERDHALIYCLRRGADIAEGCVLAVKAKLPESSITLERSLFESLVWTRWVALSDENARAFSNAAKYELKRLLRKNLQAGYARVANKITKQDRSSEILQSTPMKIIPNRLLIEDKAKVTGLERVKTMIYGFQSIHAHGTAFGIISNGKLEKELYASAMSALGFIQCINLTVQNWIISRKQTPISDINRILGV